MTRTYGRTATAADPRPRSLLAGRAGGWRGANATRLVVAALLGAGLAAALAGCGRAAPTVAGGAQKFTIVDAASPRLQLRGVVDAPDAEVVSNPYGLEILRILRRDGERVAKGDLLLELDVSRERESLARLRRDLAAAEASDATRAAASTPLERAQAEQRLSELDGEIRRTRAAIRLEEVLSRRGVVDAARAEEATRRLERLVSLRRDVASAALALAALGSSPIGPSVEVTDLRRAIEKEETLVAAARVVARTDGLFRALQPLRPGPPEPGPIASVYAPGSLTVNATVWQNELLEIEVGQEGVVHPDFLPTRTGRCRVSAEIPHGTRTLDPATSMEISRFPIRLEFVGGAAGFLPGMSVTIVFPGEQGVAEIPRSFVAQGAAEHWVLVESTGSPPRRVPVEVRPGRTAGFLRVRGVEPNSVLIAPDTAP